jgi:hypothetical protein
MTSETTQANTTSETKHTPGPWHVGMKPGPMVYGRNGEWVANCCLETNTRGENLDNARLIAAAPELLKLAELIASRMDDYRTARIAVEMAEQVLRKIQD